MKFTNLIDLFNRRLTAGLLILAITLISLPAVFRLLRPGFFPMYDDMQVIRVEQMHKCIEDGQIPCRWVPDLGYGYGYPLFDYYAPLPYYFMEVIHLIGFSFIDCVKIGFIASVFLSAFFFFLLARRFFGVYGSLLTSFVWTMVPFRAADIFVRGAMGEAWGMALLPAYLWGFEKFIHDKDSKSFAMFSLTGGLFFISHNLTVIMSLPLIAIWFVARSRSAKGILKYLVLSVVLSLSLASFYVVPLIVGHNLVHIETLTKGYFNFINHFSSIKQIFFSTHWGYGPSEVGSGDDAFVGIGPLHLILGVIGFVATFIDKTKSKTYFFATLFLTAFLYAFLMHAKSTPFWQVFPFMKYFQFPWRLALPASFIFSFLSGCFYEKIPRLIKPVTFIFTIALILIVYGSFFAPKQWLNISDKDKLEGEARELAQTASIYDYLPKSAQINPAQKAPNGLIVDEGRVDVFSSTRGSDWYRFNIIVKSENATLVVPAYDFPGWQVYVDGKHIPHERFGDLGLISVKTSQGTHRLDVFLVKTSLKIASDAITFLAFVTISSLLIKIFQKR